VDYPILVYPDCSPMNEKLMIANLGIDCPQLRIDINPYKFIKFVKANDQTKIQTKPKLKEDESIVFFLV
jgi:hypothetical protein